MKKNILKNTVFLFLSVLLTGIISSCSSKQKKTYWENGNLQSVINYENGEMHCPAIWYYENGKKQQELTYFEGMINSTMYRYYQSGQEESIAEYRIGLLDGPAFTFY